MRKRALALALALILACLVGLTAGLEGARAADGAAAHADARAAATTTVAKKKKCRRGRARRCRRHSERNLPVKQVHPPRDSVPSGPDGGKYPDLQAPWQPGVTFVAGGDCGSWEGQGAHQDYDGRWSDDSHAIDFGLCGGADFGIKVVAATSGVVRVSGYDRDLGWNVVVERSPNGIATRYGHLARKPLVSKNDRVGVGDQLGVVGNSGLGGQSRAASHLHFALFAGRGRHKGLSIRRLSRQVPCRNCKVTARPIAPGQTLEAVTHYSCLASSFPTTMFLRPGEKVVQPFVAQGSQVTAVSVAANGPYNELTTAFRARIGIYTQADSLPAYAVTERTVNLPQQKAGGDASGVTFALDVPVAVDPGAPLFLIVTAIDDVNYYRSGPSPQDGLIGTVVGYR